VKRDKEGHYITIKGSLQEEDITIKIYMHTAICKANAKKYEMGN